MNFFQKLRTTLFGVKQPEKQNFCFKQPEQPKEIPSAEEMFNVQTFNDWFCDPNNNAVYAHKGIFLRLDKLSVWHIIDYLNRKFNIHWIQAGIPHEELEQFCSEIRNDWREKINAKK